MSIASWGWPLRRMLMGLTHEAYAQVPGNEHTGSWAWPISLAHMLMSLAHEHMHGHEQNMLVDLALAKIKTRIPWIRLDPCRL